MKKNLLFIAFLFAAFTINAQWVPVNNGLPEYPPTSITNWEDTMVVSTYGGGIYLTYDQGESWSELPGTVPSLFVNRVDYGGGQFGSIAMGCDEGPFIYVNGGYIDCNGTGLTNTNVTWWSSGFGGIVKDAVVGTRDGGVFAADYTSPFIYDWSSANAGLTGDALFINDGLVGEGLAMLATDGGFYKAVDNETVWTAKNNGLSGDALKVNDFVYLGALILIATDGGLYYTLDFGESWNVIFPDEKFNLITYIITDHLPSDFMIFALGETGYSSEDMVTWTPMDFTGIDGEVTAAGADTTNLYLGFTTTTKSGKGNGGMYKKPMEQFIVGIEDDNLSGLSKFSLKQNHPNPFSQSTNISYSLKNSDFVSMKVYDFAGREIKTLINKFQEKGLYNVAFEAENLPNGVYTYKLQIGQKYYKSKKMILIK